MDILTAIVCLAVLFASGALVFEIAMKRPATFREMLAGAEAFAAAPVPEAPLTTPAAISHTNGQADHQRLAAA